MSSLEPSSKTSSTGCTWRIFAGAFGLFALGVAALMLINAAPNWSHRSKVSRWPLVRATLRDCKIDKRTRRRMAGRFVYYATCAATFTVDGKIVKGGFESRPAYYEHRPEWWANPGIDELRAWIGQHPDGTQVTARSDPEWPPTLELDPKPEIFDYNDNRLSVRIGGTAAVIGLALLALAFFVAR